MEASIARIVTYGTATEVSTLSRAGDSFGGRSKKEQEKNIWGVWKATKCIVWVVDKLNKLVTTFHALIVYEKPKRILSDITMSEIRISQTQRVVNTNKEDTPFHGRSELDSHADTTVAGKNCVILRYTYRSCVVAPFSDKCTPMKDVPIVSAATGYTLANGRN